MTTLWHRLLCAVGLHEWGEWHWRPWYPTRVERRMCQRCYADQWRSLQ
jgi:hypothetical protein